MKATIGNSRPAAEAEGLPAANVEAARRETAVLYAEMQEAARHLLICMPTDPKGLVDLLMYLEKNFTVLPQEITHGKGIAKYDKHGPTS